MDANTLITVVSLILNAVQVMFLAYLRSRATTSGHILDETLAHALPPEDEFRA